MASEEEGVRPGSTSNRLLLEPSCSLGTVGAAAEVRPESALPKLSLGTNSPPGSPPASEPIVDAEMRSDGTEDEYSGSLDSVSASDASDASVSAEDEPRGLSSTPSPRGESGG